MSNYCFHKFLREYSNFFLIQHDICSPNSIQSFLEKCANQLLKTNLIIKVINCKQQLLVFGPIEIKLNGLWYYIQKAFELLFTQQQHFLNLQKILNRLFARLFVILSYILFVLLFLSLPWVQLRKRFYLIFRLFQKRIFPFSFHYFYVENRILSFQSPLYLNKISIIEKYTIKEKSYF